MPILHENEIQWSPNSHLDPFTKTFIYDGTYYRAVKKEAAEYFSSLFSDGTIDQLNENKLIPESTISDIQLEGYAFTIRQQTEHFNVNPKSFSPEMMRNAALMYLNLSEILEEKGLALVDGHPYNIIVQENNLFKWCDIGSIVNTGDDAQCLYGLDEFMQRFLYPLMMRSKTPVLGRLSRFYFTQGCTHEEAKIILGESVEVGTKNRRQLIEYLMAYFTDLHFDYTDSIWNDYHQQNHGALFNDPEIMNIENLTLKKSHARDRILKKLFVAFKPRYVIDFGANAGFFSLLAAQTGAEVLAYELEEMACDRCYQNFRNFVSPTGVKMHCKASLSGFSPYLVSKKADLSLALALTHHLYFTHDYSFMDIARILANSTTDKLLTEFMPKGLGVKEPHMWPMPEDYSLDVLTSELRKYFAEVETMPYPGSQNRILVICQKRFAA